MSFDDTLWPDGTLKNLLGIHDRAALSRIEYEHTLQLSGYLIDHPIKITSSRQLIQIHKYLFQAIYPWAGKVRDYELAKGNTVFMFSSQLDHGFAYIDDLLQKLPKGKVSALDYARLLDSLNYLHPFREGNGRSTRLFLQLLAMQHGQFLDYPRHLPDLIHAENNSDIPALARLLTIIEGCRNESY